MSYLLQFDSASLGEASVSRQVAQTYTGPSPAAGRPAVLISARGGGYGQDSSSRAHARARELAAAIVAG